jgi:hypothetical protein
LPVGIVVSIMLLALHFEPVGYLNRSKWLLFLLVTGGVSALAVLMISRLATRQLNLIKSRG